MIPAFRKLLKTRPLATADMTSRARQPTVSTLARLPKAITGPAAMRKRAHIRDGPYGAHRPARPRNAAPKLSRTQLAMSRFPPGRGLSIEGVMILFPSVVD
ncbi:Uncharacterised protein [Mycobacterium tuberculosis]|nr:Uncharacterised protein [Mycobacterium tuberculosis]